MKTGNKGCKYLTELATMFVIFFLNFSLVYVYDEAELEYKFYQVLELLVEGEEKKARCKKIATSKDELSQFGLNFGVPLHTVGVYKFQYFEDTIVTLERKDFHGKAMKVMNYILSIPTNVLLEAT